MNPCSRAALTHAHTRTHTHTHTRTHTQYSAHRRHDQRPVRAKQLAEAKPPAIAQLDAVDLVEQPLVGTEWRVEPHRVVQGRHHRHLRVCTWVCVCVWVGVCVCVRVWVGGCVC